MISKTRPAPKAGRDLPAAIGVGVALFVALIAGLIWAPWFFVTLVAVGLGLAAIEVHGALQRKGLRAEIWPIAIGTVISVLGGYLVSLVPARITPTTFVVICLCATLIAALVARLFRGAEGFIRDVAASAFIIAYVPLMGIFVPLLMSAPHGTRGILVIVMCAVGSDTGAYAVGVLFGRHKMAPSISPGKTWEGFAGGVALAAGLGLACCGILRAPWWVGLILGLLVSLAATLGDLVESLIKRDAGIKDMSDFLPGHGGIMDRLDSMLLAVPVGWMVLHLAFGP